MKYSMLSIIILYVYLSVLFCPIICKMTKVTIDQGTLVGQRSITSNGFEYFEFLQVPYAKPPVGHLRFKSPQFPEPWEGDRNATTVNEANICFQYDNLRQLVVGSEDCLYLNVFTPKLPTPEQKTLPVMLFIHGGGFVFGSGIIKETNGPDYLIENDVVVVFINYRLGAFGFLSLDIPEAAGNMGLKDQVMALTWIQNNIDKFGGDINNVTVFGISAGAASIEYLMLSPLSKGLFHKAIIQSGSALNPWAINYNNKDLGIKLAQDLGYHGPAEDNRAIYEVIFNQPFEILSKSALKFSMSANFKGIQFGLVPSIEKDFGNGEAFLTEHPYDLLKDGRFNKVPVIRGFCQFEGYLLAGEKQKDLQEMVHTKRFFDFWGYSLNANDMEYYNSKLKRNYLGDNKYDEEDQFAIDFSGDYYFTSGILTSSKLMAKNGVQLYLYKFSYDGNLNLIKNLLKLNRKGAGHGDDTAYVIKTFTPRETNINENDTLICKRFAAMWTNFAKTSNPTPKVNELISLPWPVFNVDELKYMIIDTKLQVSSNYEPRKMALFEEIYENYHI